MSLRICIVTSSFPLNPEDTVNAGVFVREFAKELVKLGQHVHVFTPRKDGYVERDAELPTHFFPWWGGAKDLASARISQPKVMLGYLSLVFNGMLGLSRYVRRNRIAFCLSMWAIPSGILAYGAKRRSGVPYAIWALGSDVWKRKEYPLGERLVRLVMRNADALYADGRILAKDVEGISGRQCVFLPSSRTLPKKSPPAGLVDKAATSFLYIGRWEEAKGPDLLLEAMRLLLKEGEGAKLYLFGGGSLEKSLKAKAQEWPLSGNVIMGGYADPLTVSAYMQQCDCLVIPSRIESIPLIFSDALQMGTPVIASDVGDLGFLVSKYDVGRVVPPGDVPALKEAMKAFLKAGAVEASRYRANMPALAKQFDLAQVAQRFLHDAEEIVCRKR